MFTRRTRSLFFALLLFALNAYVCRELFTAGPLHNLDSNEGVFVAISRFFREHFFDQRWYPWFNCGMPIQNAYQPLLPLTAAAVNWISGWPLERAFHFVLAVVYCAGPVTLFWFAWEWSESLVVSGAAGLAYSLTSYGELLIPILRVEHEGHWAPLRLYNLIHYAEDPHNMALTLLPVALLFLRRVALKRSGWNVVGAVLASAAVVATNGFGAVDLAVGSICIAVTLRLGFVLFPAVGLATWLLISPWMPPSLIATIRADQLSARGLMHSAGEAGILTLAVALGFVLLWLLTRRVKGGLGQFSLLFSLVMAAIPLAFFWKDLSLVPQANRYQLELEMALCLLTGCLVGWLASKHRAIAALLLVGSFFLAGVQAKHYRRFARTRIEPIDLARTVEARSAAWISRNLPGQRVMVGGREQFLFDVLTDNPQLGGGHEPQVPNWMDRVAVYTIYTDGSPATSTFWMKAFGVQAISIPADPEASTLFAHPRKFEGVLPVLWREDGDTVYEVPQRSRSLAHVVPREAITARVPAHGLDLDPVRAYVAALDDPALPEIGFVLHGTSASISGPVAKGQVVSVQETFDPGWEATANGKSASVHADALGLTVVEPDCAGDCRIELRFGVTREAWICRMLSGFVFSGLVLIVLRTARRRRLRRVPVAPAG